MGSRNIGMFLEPGPETLNEITLVAPTGFEPVFQGVTPVRGLVDATGWIRRATPRAHGASQSIPWPHQPT